MSLLGSAAVVISFDLQPGSEAEHDEWHTCEHMPERLSIPGFLRGTRWRSDSANPRYLVLYEVCDRAVLTSPAYLDRLNSPSPWTTAMMERYRNMARALCRVVASVGHGLGGTALLVCFDDGREGVRQDWLAEQLMPWLATQPGIVAAHVLVAATAPPMTSEQRIRGKDSGIACALFATGYDQAGVARALSATLEMVESVHARSSRNGVYRLAQMLTAETMSSS